MSVYARNNNLGAYKSVSVHGAVAGADPHRLVQMLMDGVLERLAVARVSVERGDIGKKAKLLHSCNTLLGELRGSLNMTHGGPLARNLNELYEYMMRQLLRANADNNIEYIKEVSSLLGEVRNAWTAIAPEVRQTHATAQVAMSG